MKTPTIISPGFTIVGISGRTNNSREMSGDGVITKFWQRLMQEGIFDQIPNRVDSNIIALYTDYAGDKDGDYTFILGGKVHSTESIPDGMVSHNIPAGQYAVITSEGGPGWKVVPAAWQRVWAIPDSELPRAFQTDYELYDERAANPENAVVDLYVGIR
jgi:predicted transcriptional regulator YdeE